MPGLVVESLLPPGRQAQRRARRNAWIESIKVNAVSREVHDERTFCVKRRRACARPILVAANIFFRLVRAPVRTIANRAQWQRWEIESFRGLHGDIARCFASGTRAVAAEELSGMNLTGPLDTGGLTEAMARAVGTELRRAHGIRCEFFKGGWSHGDPHLGNFVFDPATCRARIIDFELRHVPSLPEHARRLDDVLTVVHDLLGRSTSSQWVPSAHAFVEGYGQSAVTKQAIKQLARPRGVASIWWSIRTSWLPREEARRRINALREAMAAAFD